ncbi:enoyl-CoA hydratase-related protein [Sphingomonas sp. IC4-52]|uniref:enoyl-CoA hydratase-related protein n=1 Tax=Sphingomonas sp. IC4-52 TaxID=2887202 RepID=UPI001D114897|nr:enoyl-CoA hydratase-related protein [Sphingomonas sp. IC4-52]MCC2981171.1 enoyl-CoA hydratase/isomerase family protein [Sphingomonas sp. IC4-52]
MTDTKTLAASIEGNLCIIRLQRPEVLNAFDYEMLEALRRAVDAAVADERVFAIVITGAGRAFCAGIDVSLLQRAANEGASGGGAGAGDGLPRPEGPALFAFLLHAPKPVIAAVNGIAAGGGFVLSMMSDLRFMAADASFTTVFSRRGLVAEHGMSWLLPRQLGTSRALDLLWSSRRVGADEALRLGLADRLTAPDALLDEVRRYVDDMAATVAPRAIATIKRQVYDHWAQDFLAASAASERLMQDALAHPDAAEGARSFIERRPPHFRPLGENQP